MTTIYLHDCGKPLSLTGAQAQYLIQDAPYLSGKTIAYVMDYPTALKIAHALGDNVIITGVAPRLSEED